jgi:hypothetical protein
MKVRIQGYARVAFSTVLDMSDGYDPKIHEPELEDVIDGALDFDDMDIVVNEIEDEDEVGAFVENEEADGG